MGDELGQLRSVSLVKKVLLWISCAVFACLFKSRCRSSLLFPFAVVSVLDPDGHVHRECTKFCVRYDHDHYMYVQPVGTVTLD